MTYEELHEWAKKLGELVSEESVSVSGEFNIILILSTQDVPFPATAWCSTMHRKDMIPILQSVIEDAIKDTERVH